jgi:hypothetical protein
MMPAARASGAVTVWIQPRHFGLIISSSASLAAASSTALGPGPVPALFLSSGWGVSGAFGEWLFMDQE